MSPALQTIAAALAADPAPASSVWLPPAASNLAGDYDAMFHAINYVCYFFFVVVVAAMLYFVVKYRVRKGQAFRSDGPLHNLPLETSWAVVPLLIVIFIFYVGFRDYLNMTTPPKNAYVIKVTAQKWAWNFQYPNGATSDDLYIPAGRPVQLTMRASDVLHSCYIPDFRVKKDVVPGRYSTLWFQCDYPTGMPGKDVRDPNAKTVEGPLDAAQAHALFCTEYCGTGHSKMNRYVYVLDEASFNQWMVDQSQWIDKIPEEELYFKAGPKIFGRCVQCHSLDGTNGIGPSWKGIVDRVKAYPFVGEGKKYATYQDYIRTSILAPGDYVVPPYANAMPTFKGQLNDKAIDAVIGYMEHLDEFDPKTGKHLKAAAAK